MRFLFSVVDCISSGEVPITLTKLQKKIEWVSQAGFLPPILKPFRDYRLEYLDNDTKVYGDVVEELFDLCEILEIEPIYT